MNKFYDVRTFDDLVSVRLAVILLLLRYTGCMGGFPYHQQEDVEWT